MLHSSRRSGECVALLEIRACVTVARYLGMVFCVRTCERGLLEDIRRPGTCCSRDIGVARGM
jgi:hypothetical protein